LRGTARNYKRIKFQLGIFAPLPADFLGVCADLDIHIGATESKGGVFIDEVRIDEGDISQNYNPGGCLYDLWNEIADI
jgi:hypothetical protein